MINNMKTSEAGVALIKHFESLRLFSYVCPAGKLTIGYGHTGPDVKPKQIISNEQAEQLLANDIAEVENQVNRLITTSINQHRFDALVSFTFNEGTERLKTSTLLHLINLQRFDEAARQFALWDKAHVNGEFVELPGLKARREAEVAIFKG